MADKEKSVPILSRLKAPEGAVRAKRRKGRGVGSGLGKTAGHGMKGQKARHPGDFSKLGFEGGQMPLYRRLPKRGFKNPFTKSVGTVNVKDLSRFDAGATIDQATLLKAGLVKPKHQVIKLLGTGEIDKALTIKVNACSGTAKEKVEKAGGSVELIS